MDDFTFALTVSIGAASVAYMILQSLFNPFPNAYLKG